MTALEAALEYYRMGFNVIPLWYGEKKPILSSWQEFQERRMTEEEVRKFFSGEERNIGIICGLTSGNLVAVDFDDMEVYEKAMQEGFYSTDDSALVEHYGGKIGIVMGSYRNLKITTPEDLDMAEFLLRNEQEYS